MNPVNITIFTQPISWNRLTGFFLFLGCAIRAFHFFADRSLWLDEVYLVSGLVHLDFKGLVEGPLDYQQKAPIGFLLLVKLCINCFGNDEIWLRLVPFLSGLFTLFLFVPVCRYFLGKPGSLVAIGVICLSPAFIYHSVEIKQYATELLGSVLTLYLYIKYKDRTDYIGLLIWGFTGAIILWFSYSAIFLYAGISFALSINYMLKQEWRVLFLRFIPFMIWGLSFAINYLLFTHKHTEAAWIVNWFRFYENFMPLPPKSISDLKWFAITFYRMLDYPLGLLWNFNNVDGRPMLNAVLKMSFLPFGLLLLGMYKFFKHFTLKAFVLSFSILFTLLASGLELYPLTERFWLFISPVFLIVIGKGFDQIWNKVSVGWSYLIFLAILTGPVSQALGSLFHSENFYMHKKSYQKEMFKYVNDNFKDGDGVYVYWNILPQFRLYAELQPYRFKAIEGKDFRAVSADLTDYQEKLALDLNQFKGKRRVWLALSHKFMANIGDKINEPGWYYKKDGNPTDIVVKEFLKLGRLEEKKVTTDVTIFLFTLK